MHNHGFRKLISHVQVSVYTGGIAMFLHSIVSVTELRMVNNKFRLQCSGGL
jgi:hypothetical protein